MFRALASLFVALALIFAPTFASGATVERNGYFLNLDTIRQVVCFEVPKGMGLDPTKWTPAQAAKLEPTTGTGEIVAENRVVTAHHVIVGSNLCLYKSHVARVVFDDPKNDFTVLQVDLGRTGLLAYSCDGYVKGATYFAIGYSLSQDFAVQLLCFTGEYRDDLSADDEGKVHMNKHIAMLDGEVFAGMSGGAVVDSSGKMVGIVNAGDESSTQSRDLADTPLCAALKPQAVAAAHADKPVTTSRP